VTVKKLRLPQRLPGSFRALVSLYPPRAIRDRVDYDNVQEILDRLTSLPRMTKGHVEYLDTLTVLFEAYENRHFEIETDRLSTREVLRYIMEQHSMSASDLGRMLGDRSLGSRILNGRRRLSKEHIKVLCGRFSVSADLFLD